MSKGPATRSAGHNGERRAYFIITTGGLVRCKPEEAYLSRIQVGAMKKIIYAFEFGFIWFAMDMNPGRYSE